MINFGHESEQLEFKKSTGETKEAMIDIVAILNKHGDGTLYFGVTPTGDAKGQQVSESTLRDVSRVIYESIKPQIFPQIQKITLDGCDLIEVKFSGRNKPYSAYGKYYIRVADESRELTPSELRDMMLCNEYSERWEQYDSGKTIDDIDIKTLSSFYDRAVACGRMPVEEFNAEQILTKLGLLKDGKVNNAGYALFGSRGPITIKMAVFATDEKLTFLDINRMEDNIFNLVDIAIAYIKRNIRWRATITETVREEIPEIPLNALREIVINSFAHAQYGTASQHEIDIHPSKVVVYNPGEFPPEYSPEDFATKNLPSIIRNDLITKVLYLCHDIETFGSGFKRVYSLCVDVDVKCDYEKTPYGFSFVFNRRLLENSTTNTNVGNVKLSSTESSVIELLRSQPTLTREEIAISLSKSIRTIQRALVTLKDCGMISRIGTIKNGYWKIN